MDNIIYKKLSYNNYKKFSIIDEENTEYDLLKNIVNKKLSFENEYCFYDFNNGFRIKFKNNKKYRVIINDYITGQTYWDKMIYSNENTIYCFEKKYLINYEIHIFYPTYGYIQSNVPKDIIKFDLYKKDIAIYLSSDEDSPSGLGDSLAWLNAIQLFAEKNKTTNIYVCTSFYDLENLLITHSNLKSNIKFITNKEAKEKIFYASYLIGVFFLDKKRDYSVVDYRTHSLIECATNVLGIRLSQKEIPYLQIKLSHKKPKKHQVCIAVHASGIGKEWLFKNGWDKTIDLLNLYNYDVYDIDLNKINNSSNFIYTEIPHNVIDLTGNISLLNRAEMISKSDFFIGVSSGLAWLAWCCNIPVVLISGFTNPITEFYTPYRIINYAVCNSCWNDMSIQWKMGETTCPYSKNPFGDDFLMCSTSIDVSMVYNKIKQITNFINYTKK